MTRIAVGGFLHETNTFAPTKASYDDFVHGGGWPSMALGKDVLTVMRNINVGLAGFVAAAEAEGWELVPTISAAASPSAHVTEDAYERIAKVMVDGIKTAGSIDAVYLGSRFTIRVVENNPQQDRRTLYVQEAAPGEFHIFSGKVVSAVKAARIVCEKIAKSG